MTTDITLRINYKTEFYALQDLIIATIISLGLSGFLLFYGDLPFVALILLGFYLFLFLAPVIILHSNYEKFNKNKELTFRNDKLEFANEIFEYKNIDKIKAVGTYQSINKTSLSELPYQCAYFYILLEMKNGKKIHLTSLYSKDLIEIISNRLPNHIIEKELTSFPSIKNYS